MLLSLKTLACLENLGRIIGVVYTIPGDDLRIEHCVEIERNLAHEQPIFILVSRSLVEHAHAIEAAPPQGHRQRGNEVLAHQLPEDVPRYPRLPATAR